MSNVKHTPKSWQEDDCRNALGHTTIRRVDPKAPDCPHGDTENHPIATVYADEDCALIAAAPDLLKALEDSTKPLPMAGGASRRAVVEQRRKQITDAIAKAKGE